MDNNRIPRPGEIYKHFKDKLYQIITVASNTETGELMVVYQALYGDFKTYVRPLEMFISEVDRVKYPEVQQKYRFELQKTQVEQNLGDPDHMPAKAVVPSKVTEEEIIAPEGTVNSLLLKFLDADSYNKKLEILTSNTKHLNDRLINDMAVALDCSVDDGPLDQRIQGLVHCLQAMSRFEDRRLR